MTAQAKRDVWRWSVSLSGGLVAAAFAFVVLMLCAVLARAQEAGAALAPAQVPAPFEIPGWGESTGRVLLAGIVDLLLIEGVRWLVPGWERDKGVKLDPAARKWIAALVVAFGQACAWVGYPLHALLTTPFPDVPMAQVCAGLGTSLASIVFNELLWKRLVHEVQDRFGVMPARLKEKRKLRDLNTGEFRALRSAEETPAPGVDPTKPAA